MGLCQSRTQTSNTIGNNYSVEYINSVKLPEKYHWILLVKNTYDIDHHLFECKKCGIQFHQAYNTSGSCKIDGPITYHALNEDDKVFYSIIKSNQSK